MADYEHCTVEKEGHLLIVTMNRPNRMNALHPPANFELATLSFGLRLSQVLAIALSVLAMTSNGRLKGIS